MTEKIDFQKLVEGNKTLTALTREKEALLVKAGTEIKPFLGIVTEAFYEVLQTIPNAHKYLEGRLERLKDTHRRWLESLFTGPFDETYAREMYNVGMAHVKVKLPVEFMEGAATLIMDELVSVIAQNYRGDAREQSELIKAVNAVIGFSVTIMQESYQTTSLAEELERFLAITGMSRTLFNNLAAAYQEK